MIRSTAFAVLLLAPWAAHAQRPAAGPTQDRSGLGAGSGSQVDNASNSLPAGSINAQTGPQSRPAYSSGASTTPNPGQAFVRDTARPAGGPAQSSPGTLSVTTIAPGGKTTSKAGGAGVGAAARPPQ